LIKSIFYINSYSLYSSHDVNLLASSTTYCFLYISDALGPPTDLRVFVSGVKATLIWVINDDLDLVRYFRITYEIFNGAGNFFKISHNIDGIRRSYTLRGLAPVSTYRVFMVTIGSGEVSNASETIEFSTAIPGNDF